MHDCTKILYHNKAEKQTYIQKICSLFALKVLTCENMFDIINNHKEQMFPTNVRTVCSSIYYYKSLSERKR